MIEIKYLRPELLEAIARNTLKKYDEGLVSGYEAKEVPIEEIIESIGLSLEYALCEREWISQKDWNHCMV